MDSWSAEAVAIQSYIRNANLWEETYKEEIRTGKEENLHGLIRKRYNQLAKKVGQPDKYKLMRKDVDIAFNLIYN